MALSKGELYTSLTWWRVGRNSCQLPVASCQLSVASCRLLVGGEL
jgi:hypothetical protein